MLISGQGGGGIEKGYERGGLGVSPRLMSPLSPDI